MIKDAAVFAIEAYIWFVIIVGALILTFGALIGMFRPNHVWVDKDGNKL